MTAAKSKTRSAGAAAPGGDATVHDDFYRNLRAKITDWAKKKDIDASYRDYILLVPDMFHFLTRLIMEPVVAMKDKAWIGVAVAYVLSPIDFIPDALFPLGLVDDLIVMVIVLDSVLGNVPRRLVKKHWAGSGDLFDAVRDSLAKADGWVGKGMFRRLKNYLKKQGVWKEETPATPPPVPKTAKTATRKKTPSRRPAAKKTAAKKTAAKKTTKKAAKKTTKKKTTKKTAAKKSTAKKSTAKKRTIAKKRTTKKGSSSS